MLTDRFGRTISDFISENGEKPFRDEESAVIGQAAEKRGYIIATGGGAVLREENVRAMKKNGTVVFLDRDPALLTATKDRPLSSTREALEKLYEERYPIYKKAADMTVPSDRSVGEVAEDVRKELEIR